MRRDDLIDELCLVDWPEGEGAPALDTLRPPSLAPRAVLLIRSLSVVGAPERVGQAVEAEVAGSLAAAARPRRGRLPLDADAVVFADETEAAAAFLVALALGTAARQWWWGHLDVAHQPLPLPVLLAAPHPLAVVAHLVRWGFLAAALEAVPPAYLAPLVRAVAGRHGLTVRADPPGTAAAGTPAPGRDEPAPSRPPRFAGPEAPPRLVVSRHGREITSGPADRDGVRAVLSDLVVALLGRGAAAGPADAPTGAGAAGRVRPPVTTTPRETPVADDSPVGPEDDATAEPVGPGVASSRGDPTTGPRREPAPAAAPRAGDAPDPVAAVPRVVPASPRADPAAWPALLARELVRTDLAGALFLVNPLGAWSRAPAPSAAAGLTWDLLEAVAREILGRDDDPLWAALAAVAGRDEGETPPPGTGGAATRAVGRLVRELRLDQEDLAELLAVPGIVVHDLTHIDVELPMHRVHLATRRRGLDLDPGWVPALARVVAFHYRDDLP